MKRLVPFVALVAASCAPDIAQNPPPSGMIVANFDPGAAVPVVPLPNDLARDQTTGKIVVPPTPGESAAQREFEDTYLQTLTGFPFESPASMSFSGDVKPETITTTNVITADITNAMAPGLAMVTPTYDMASKTVTIQPPMGGWTRGHQYAVAVIGGAKGVQGAHGEAVIGSPTWSLVSSPTPLVTCQDLTAADCKPAVDIIPSNIIDPAMRLADQTAKAKQLEQIRRAYGPLLDGIHSMLGIARGDIVLAWTFTIVDAAEATFDPANSVIPFPNNFVYSAGQVALPNPKTGKPLDLVNDCLNQTDQQILLVCGLDQLDGFSTQAPLVSENSAKAGALSQGNIDPATLSPMTVGLVSVSTMAPMAEQTKIDYTPCLNCTSSPDAMGKPQTSPQELQWKLNVPLDEKTTYFGWVSQDLKDDKGKSVIATPTFALLRLTNPLYDGAHSTVNLITDDQAKQLEPLRKGMNDAFAAAEAAGVKRTSMALGFAFTTQSEGTYLDTLYAFPGTPDAATSDQIRYISDQTPLYKQYATIGNVPFTHVGKVLVGEFTTPVAVTGIGGTFALGRAKPEPMTFVLYLPATAAPASGYPVTIFGHGYTRSKQDSIAIADTLNGAGMAVIATDILWHGERSSCTGFKASDPTMPPSDDNACADPSTMKCNEAFIGRCVLKNGMGNPCKAGANDPTGDLACFMANQGRCVSGFCEGGDFSRKFPLEPDISGWNTFSGTNFFATRDNLRQQVIDLAQLVRVIKAKGAMSLQAEAMTTLDASKMGYVGQSLGGILGTLFNAVSPDTTYAVLDVPGGDWITLITQSPSVAAQRQALYDILAKAGILQGTPAFDQFLNIARWVLDPADPANLGWRLTHGVNGAPNANRKAFIQFIEKDQFVINPTNFALVHSAIRDKFQPTMPPSYGCSGAVTCYEFTEAGDGFDMTSVPLNERHGFMLSGAPTNAPPALHMLAVKAQGQVAKFLTNGTIQ